jgi:hypothetical protein
VELHTGFASAELRKEEHRRMLWVIERERSSRMVQFVRHQWHRLRMDGRELRGARRVIRVYTPWLRRVRAK